MSDGLGLWQSTPTWSPRFYRGAEVSAEVGRLIAAHAEVERLLAFPRPIAATP